MRKKILLAVIALLAVTLACLMVTPMRIADWEQQQGQGSLTPPVNEYTKYLCVIPMEEGRGALAANGYFSEVIPSGTKLIDSGRRWEIANKYAVVYYKGYALNIALNLVEECE